MKHQQDVISKRYTLPYHRFNHQGSMAIEAITSRQKMRDEIRRLNRINPEKASYDTIKKIAQSLHKGRSVLIGETRADKLFFRARKASSRPKKVSELCAPPSALIEGFQRFNAPGSAMLYCSSRRITALLECDPESGETFYLSQWIGKENLPINNTIGPDEPTRASDRPSPVDDMYIMYLDTLFTKPVDRAISDRYKVGAAFAELLTQDFLPGYFNIGSDGRTGLRYPSVIDLEGSYNTAFPPNFAPDRMQLCHVIELKIVERNGNQLQINLSDMADVFDDGNIIWSGDVASIPLPKTSKGVPFRWQDGRWHLLNTRLPKIPSEDIPNLLDFLMHE